MESELLQILFRVPEADDAAADVCLKKKKKKSRLLNLLSDTIHPGKTAFTEATPAVQI